MFNWCAFVYTAMAEVEDLYSREVLCVTPWIVGSTMNVGKLRMSLQLLLLLVMPG